MGKINMQKVLIGGAIAGVVLNVIDFVLFGMVLKDQMAAAMTAINRPAMTNAQIPWFVFLDFVAGVFLVWLYAAIRPRFGAGDPAAVWRGSGDSGKGRHRGMVRGRTTRDTVHVAHALDATEPHDYHDVGSVGRMAARHRHRRQVLYGRGRDGCRDGRGDGRTDVEFDRRKNKPPGGVLPSGGFVLRGV